MQTVLKIPGFTDNIFTHLLAGLGAGFFAVCIGSPVDVVSYSYTAFFLFRFFVVGGCFFFPVWIKREEMVDGDVVARLLNLYHDSVKILMHEMKLGGLIELK